MFQLEMILFRDENRFQRQLFVMALRVPTTNTIFNHAFCLNAQTFYSNYDTSNFEAERDIFPNYFKSSFSGSVFSVPIIH